MRLTLRTLLAYLDDTLEPSQIKLIGQKVAESPAAQELIARIKQVPRRRRLTVPADAGPGAKFDSNSVAEYLDNALPPEQVTDVEEACLASDVHLAEVVACHQILTLMLGEPMQVPPLARQRMYELVRGGGRTRAVKAKAPKPLETVPEGDEADEMLLMGLPRYHGQGSWRRWLLSYGLVTLLIIGMGGALVAAFMLGRHSHEGPPVAQASTSEPEKQPDPDKQAEADRIAKEKQQAEADRIAKEKQQAEADRIAKEKQQAEADRIARDKKAAQDKKRSVPAPSKERTPTGEFVTEDSILLNRERDKDWQRVRRGARVSTDDELVSLPGYRSEVRLDSHIHAMLWGTLPPPPRDPQVLECALRLHADPLFDLDFTLERGRVVLSNHKPQGPASVRLRFHGEAWELVLQNPETEVAVELWGNDPLDRGFTKDPRGEGPMASLVLLVLKGEAKVKVGYETFTIPSPRIYGWDSIRGPLTVMHLKVPEWASKVPGLDLKAPARRALEKLSTDLSGKENVSTFLTATLSDRDIPTEMLAVFCIGAIDQLSALLDALADDKEEIRYTAHFVLQRWISRGPEQEPMLKRMLVDKKGYTEDQAELLRQLLHTFPDEQAGRPETYEALIAYLDNEKVAIRELAHRQLQVLVRNEAAQKIPYDAAGDTNQRKKAIEQWKKLIPDGKLPPEPEPPKKPPK
jgi:hypothetical protein